MVPASGRRRPMMHSTAVVLPAPLGPRMPKISSSRTENETSSTATVRPYVLRRCETSITSLGLAEPTSEERATAVGASSCFISPAPYHPCNPDAAPPHFFGGG